MSTEAAPYVVALELECDRLRSSLSTAEKERDEYQSDWATAVGRRNALERALRAMCAFHIAVAEALDDGPGDGVCELSEETIRLGELANDALTGLEPLPESTEDAPTAPKASEIASDSSALEKALGALRALLDVIHGEPDMNGTERLSFTGSPAKRTRAIRLAREALSGGAHVDGPKAQKEDSK